MTNRLVIIGAGGHSKVVADIALLSQGYNQILYLDDGQPVGTQLKGGKVVGKVSDWQRWQAPDSEFFVAIGNNAVRKELFDMMFAANAAFATLIHPSAIIADCVSIDVATLIVAGAVINPATEIGKGCIINTSSSVDHDCVIKDFVHIAPGCSLAGTITLGEQCFLGIGSKIIPGVTVGAQVTVGAGAVVVRDIDEGLTVVGCPAKPQN